MNVVQEFRAGPKCPTGIKVVINGEDVTGRCKSVKQFDDGTLEAECFLHIDGKPYLDGRVPAMETLRGPGTISLP